MEKINNDSNSLRHTGEQDLVTYTGKGNALLCSEERFFYNVDLQKNIIVQTRSPDQGNKNS